MADSLPCVRGGVSYQNLDDLVSTSSSTFFKKLNLSTSLTVKTESELTGSEARGINTPST